MPNVAEAVSLVLSMVQHARQRQSVPLISSLLNLLLLLVQVICLLGNGKHALLVILLCSIAQSTLHSTGAQWMHVTAIRGGGRGQGSGGVGGEGQLLDRGLDDMYTAIQCPHTTLIL